MNKQEIQTKIMELPKFVKRSIAVRKDENIQEGINCSLCGINEEFKEYEKNEKDKAITETDNIVPLAFVTKKYKLIQFDEVFLPIIQNIPELEGRIVYHAGMGFMFVFPNDEKLKINGGSDKIGIVALNSVNCQSSVIIKFCVECADGDERRIITIPKGIAGFKRVHTGKAFEMTQNFLEVVDKVRRIWKTIIENFSKTKVDETLMESIIQDIDLKEKKLIKKIRLLIETKADINLWDIFLYLIECAEIKNYKSEMHRRKKLDLISEKMFKYAVISKMI